MTESASAQPFPADTQPFVPVAPEPGPLPATEPVAPGAVTPGTSRPRSARWVTAALGLALAVAVGGVGFAAGRMTAPTTITAAGAGRFGAGQLPGGGNFPGAAYVRGDDGDDGARGFFGSGGASITGTVESISGDTLTLKLADGQTIQVSLSGTTTYHSQATASSSDVKAGGTVIVRVRLNRGQGTATSPSASDVTIVP